MAWEILPGIGTPEPKFSTRRFPDRDTGAAALEAAGYRPSARRIDVFGMGKLYEHRSCLKWESDTGSTVVLARVIGDGVISFP